MKVLQNHVLRDHVIIGAVAGALLLPFLGLEGGFLFWISTILIDLDHFFNFLYYTRFRVFRLDVMFRFYEHVFHVRRREEFLAIEPFHAIEFLAAVGGGAFWLPVIRPVFYGFLFHIAVDVVHLKRFGALTKRSHSVIEYYWRRKHILAAGGNPDRIFAETLNEMNLPSIFPKRS